MYDLKGLDDFEFIEKVFTDLKSAKSRGELCMVDNNDLDRLVKTALAGLAWKETAVGLMSEEAPDDQH